jgi:hypothetical protein
MKKLLTIAIALTLLIGVVAVVLYLKSKAAPELTIQYATPTTNAHVKWHIQFLKGVIRSIQPKDGQVQISGRIFGSYDVETHTVPVGYKFSLPDHHGSRVFTIARIDADGVLIEYESAIIHPVIHPRTKLLSEYDHGSFKIEWLDATSN